MKNHIKSVFALVPHGCTDPDTVADAVFTARVPANLAHAVCTRVITLKSIEACYAPLPTHYKCGTPTNAPVMCIPE